MNEQSIARRVIYHGRVQGVGFRFTVRSIAQRFRVTGFVRNLTDGTVELVAQGEMGEVSGFLVAVGEKLDDNISHTAESTAAPETLMRFEIRR